MQEMLYLPEAADYLERSEAAIRNLVARRKIPFRKVAGRLVFLRNEIDQWIMDSPGVTIEDLRRDLDV